MFYKLLVTAVAAATLAFAQGGGDTGGGMGSGGGMGRGGDTGGMGGGLGMNMGRTQKPTKADQIITKLKLNKDQQAEFEKILVAASQEAAPIRGQLTQGRSVLATLLVDGKPQEDVDKVIKAYVEVEAQMTNVEVKAFQKVYALLKPNQTSKAGEAFDIMADIFDIQTTRGGGMGRGMGRGGDAGGGGGSGRGRGR